MTEQAAIGNIDTYTFPNLTGEHQNFETLTGFTFEENKKYFIQNQGVDVYFRAGENGKGAILTKYKVLEYTHEGLDLYIAKVLPNDPRLVEVNVWM